MFWWPREAQFRGQAAHLRPRPVGDDVADVDDREDPEARLNATIADAQDAGVPMPGRGRSRVLRTARNQQWAYRSTQRPAWLQIVTSCREPGWSGRLKISCFPLLPA